MARGILMGLSLAAAALAVTTASFADGKPPADIVHAIRTTVKSPNVQVQGAANAQFRNLSESVCFPDRNVVCKFAEPSILDLITDFAKMPGADARFDEKFCAMVADLANKPKSDVPPEMKIERIDVPGPLARKAFALAELNQMRDEMMGDIAKQAIDAGVLHVKK